MTKKEILLENFFHILDETLENNIVNEGVNINVASKRIKDFVKANIDKNPQVFLNSLKTRLERLQIGKAMKQKLFFIAIGTLMSIKGIAPSELRALDFNNPIYNQVLDNLEEPEEEKKEVTLKPFNDFMDALKFKESSGNWKAVNSLGYMGYYQLGSSAIKDVIRTTDDDWLKKKLTGVNHGKFRKDPSIFPPKMQQKAFEQLLRNNQHYLRNHMNRIGDTINGIEVTESGLLAAAHLGGSRGVRKFLDTEGSYNPADAYGTKISDYLKKFGGYEIDL